MELFNTKPKMVEIESLSPKILILECILLLGWIESLFRACFKILQSLSIPVTIQRAPALHASPARQNWTYPELVPMLKQLLGPSKVYDQRKQRALNQCWPIFNVLKTNKQTNKQKTKRAKRFVHHSGVLIYQLTLQRYVVATYKKCTSKFQHNVGLKLTEICLVIPQTPLYL